MARLVVVGGGAAGMSTASVAKRRDPDLDVVVLEQGHHISFSACGMPYWAGGIVQGDEDRLVVLTPEEARERGLDVRMETQAVDVDPEPRTVQVAGPDGQEALDYDHLLLAPGVEPRTPWPGCELPGVHALRHLDDGVALVEDLDTHTIERACVIGGGFVGLEMAEAFVHRGLATTLIHSRATLMSGMIEPELGELVNQRVRQAGVDLVLGRRADGLEGQDRVTGVDVGDEVLDTDLVVMAIGASPRTRLAQAAGCELTGSGAIAVDDQMRTSVDGILAAGDCVAFPHRLTGEPTFLPLALHANRAGRIAGETIAGNKARFPGVLGSAITRFEDLEIAATGLTLPRAREAGFDAVAETITSNTRAGYFPGSQKIHVRMVVERGTGRVLGCQIVGGPGAGQRIDTAAAAIWMEATADDVEAMDLAYAPPFSPTWDPVAIAARIAGREAGPATGP